MYFEPRRPCSSPINRTKRIVLLVFKCRLLNTLAISTTENEPIPLSIAPVARSHESRCPPMMMVSSLRSGDVPSKVAIIFLAVVSSLLLAILISAESGTPSCSCFLMSSPDSRETHTAGMEMRLPVTEAVPVSRTPPFAPLESMIPRAP